MRTDVSRSFEFERDRQLRLASRRDEAALRRMQPHPIDPRTVRCSCCGEEFEILWSGECDGPAAIGRDLDDPRERFYHDLVVARWLRRNGQWREDGRA